MYKRTNVVARLAIGILSLYLLIGCVLPPSAPQGSPQAPQDAPQSSAGEDVTVNVAAMARLGETTQIQIEQFVETPSAGYEVAATVTDAAVIDEIVSTLDAALPLVARAPCVERYRLTFTLENGNTHTFGFLCEGGDDSILRGDVPFLADGDVQPPPQLRALIEQQIAQ